MIEDFGLYLVVTDPVAGYAACAAAAVEAKVRYLQLRMKAAERQDMLRVGLEMRRLTRGTATRFIVNDDVQVAVAVDADGLHVGQTDMTIAEARRLWPKSEHKLFGLSTHDERQAANAHEQSPDYIGVGPLFPTPTKRIADPTLGVERAAAIVRNAKVTSVAIGGIDRSRLREVLDSGMRNFAVVRAVCQHPRPIEPIRELMDTWRAYPP